MASHFVVFIRYKSYAWHVHLSIKALDPRAWHSSEALSDITTLVTNTDALRAPVLWAHIRFAPTTTPLDLALSILIKKYPV